MSREAGAHQLTGQMSPNEGANMQGNLWKAAREELDSWYKEGYVFAD